MVGENRLESLTDDQLRNEASRRRLTASALSILGSVAIFAVAYWFRDAELPAAFLAGLSIVVICNLVAVIFLFRWMSAPAKEIAKRRKRTVLRMLGSEPPSEA